MNKITDFSHDSETLYLIDSKHNDIDVPLEEFMVFIRNTGCLFEDWFCSDDSVPYYSHTHKIDEFEYWEKYSDVKILGHINQFMEIRESIAAFDIQRPLAAILYNQKY